MNLTESHIIITGGASGIGRALVEYFLDKVASVAVLDKDEESLKALTDTFDSVHVIAADLTEPKQISTALDKLFSASEGWNVLINNAGIIRSAPLYNPLNRESPIHSSALWQETIAANLSSTFYMTGPFVEQLAKRRTKGLIVNMSSISAQGNAGQSAYAAAKAGVSALAKVWASELGAWGIRAVAIAPGFFDTPSTQKALSEKEFKRRKQQVPLRRLGKLEEITNALHFVIENDYFNGKVLDLDGGLRL